MDPSRWQAAKQMLADVVDLPAVEQREYIEQHCGDPMLRRELLAMLNDPVSLSNLVATVVTLLPGTHVGAYEIVELIGAGGMGEVYRARDPRLRRDVAVKVLAFGLSNDPGRSARFEREARAAAALNHPNICTIYDVGAQDGVPYIVSEFLEGHTLRELLQHGAIPPRRVLDYAVQIAQGLAAAHEAGVVHRDLKPENLFVTRDGRVKILDFGIATREFGGPEQSTTQQVLTRPGTILGTVSYMSPEQVRGDPLDHRTDMFSCGAVLYEMLTGQRAFKRDTTAETMAAVLNDDPPPVPDGDRNAISRALRLIAGRCLEKSPRQRFQSASDLAYALELLGRDDSTPAVVGAGHRRIAKWTLAAVLVAAVVGLGLGFAFPRGDRRSEFTQVTFQDGVVDQARFAPNSDGIVYAALWGHGPGTVYWQRDDGTRPQALQLPQRSGLFAASSAGELAIQSAEGHLARVSLSGGAPKDLMENVIAADWTPDGGQLAVAVLENAETRIEFPIGTRLFATADTVDSLRVSRSGDMVAFAEHPIPGDDQGFVACVDRQGRYRALTKRWIGIAGVAWSADDREIWFSATNSTDNDRAIYAVTRRGSQRMVFRAPGSIEISDVAVDGRVLVLRLDRTIQTAVHKAGGGTTTLSWTQIMLPKAASRDDRYAVLGDWSSTPYRVFLTPIDGSPATLLGDGDPTDLSPDGKWVSALAADDRLLTLIPTGVGQARSLSAPNLRYTDARWSADGRTLIVKGRLDGEPQQFWRQDVATGALQTIHLPSADAQYVQIQGRDYMLIPGSSASSAQLYSLADQSTTSVAGLTAGDTVLAGSRTEASLIVVRGCADLLPNLKCGETAQTWTIEKIAIDSGRRSLVQQVEPPGEGSALYSRRWTIPIDDGRTLLFTVERQRNILYVATGLR